MKNNENERVMPPQKPLVIAIKEEKGRLSDAINQAAQAGLPWGVILSILDELRVGVNNIAEQEYKASEEQYSKAVQSYDEQIKKMEETINESFHG